MKNFLSIDNLNISSGESLRELIQSSSEMEGCPITNILESEDKTIWLSTEELPQEITINLSKSFFKEFPKKISAIGIYCWHAYPTNPKLIEVQISKNKGETYISLGNFDLCLKPGRQLLQLEDDSDYMLINDLSFDDLYIKLIIKETFGDKRTYINNIYLYDDINLVGKQLLTNMEPIKEEDSNSMIYLRESRERTLPKNNIKDKGNNITNKNNNLNDLLELNFDSKSDEKNKIKNKGNENIDNENKICGFESEFIISDSEFSEKCNNININANKKDDESLNKKEKEENESKNNIKENNIENKKESLNNDIENSNDLQNKKNNTKNNERYFIEKMSNEQFSKITTGKEEPNDVSEKEKSLNINDFNDEEDNDNEKNINHSINNDNYDKNNNINNYNEYDEQSNNSYKEEDLNMLIEEFEKYKKIQKQKVKNYEKKLNYLENQFKEMTLLNNKMNKTINTILESQMNQKIINHHNLLNNMRKIINDRITNVFSNFINFSNYSPQSSIYSIDSMGNEYSIPNTQYIYTNNYNTVANPNFNMIQNYPEKKFVKRNKLKSEKKILKSNNNIVFQRNKSNQKIFFRKNNNYSNRERSKNYFIMNNEENDSFSNDNLLNDIYKNEDFNNENDFQNYPLQMGNYSENNIQNFPFFKKAQIQRNSKHNSYNRNNNNFKVINSNNNSNRYTHRLNTDTNEYIINNRTQRIIGNEKIFMKKQFYNINKGKDIQGQNMSVNNEIEQTFNEFRNNLGEKISEQILRPSISKIENYMKGNLRDVKKAFLSKDKNNKNKKNEVNNKEKVEIIPIKRKI